MKKVGLALTAVALTIAMQASPAQAGGWHCNGGYHGGGGYSNDAAIIAATLFGTAAVVNAFSGPRYPAPPPVVYYPAPPPVVYYPAPPTAYYYPPPPPVPYYPSGYYRHY